MVPVAAIKYLFFSAVFVVSLFAAIRCLFANEVQREGWRNSLKHRVCFQRTTFKRLTLVIGWILLLLAMYIAYLQILDLLED